MKSLAMHKLIIEKAFEEKALENRRRVNREMVRDGAISIREFARVSALHVVDLYVSKKEEDFLELDRLKKKALQEIDRRMLSED